MARSFRFGKNERRNVQFRGELYDAPNHTQFSALDQTARFDATGAQTNPLFLTPASNRPARRAQLALKLYW